MRWNKRFSARLGVALSVALIATTAVAFGVATSTTPAHADLTAATLPDWAVGPFTRAPQNPLLTAAGGWEDTDVFNPGVVQRNNTFQMLYRAGSSEGYATSTDGTTFTRSSTNPVITPTLPNEAQGLQDARLYELDGTYYAFFSAVTQGRVDINEATSTDMMRWNDLGPVVNQNKNASVVTDPSDHPVKINGRYVMYYGEWVSGTNLAYSADMVHWTNNTPMDMHFPADYQPWEICVAVTAYQTIQGGPVNNNILVFVAGTLMSHARWYYGISEVEFSGDDLTQELAQLDDAALSPAAPYELNGQTKNTVFMNSIGFYNNQWYMYYGGGDSVVALATAQLRPDPTVNDTKLTYSSGWSYAPGRTFGDVQGDIHSSTVPGSTATYAFTGTGVDVIAEKNNDEGRLGVSIDGISKGNADLVADQRQARQVVFRVNGLTDGPHTLTLTDNGTALADVDALDVLHELTPSPVINDDEMFYDGTWAHATTRSFGDLDDDITYTSAVGGTASYSFHGTGVQYLAEKAADEGTVDVYIDDVRQAGVDLNSSARLAQQTVFEKTGLTDGRHTIKIVNTSSKIGVVDGLVILSGGSPSPSPSVGPVVVDDGGSVYDGGWVESSGRGLGDVGDGIRYSTVVGAVAQYTFSGTGVEYVAELAADEGSVDVFVDGVLASTVVLTSSQRRVRQVVFARSGLAAGEHTIRIVNRGPGIGVIDALDILDS